jgi:hypothetical protein
MSTLDLIKEIKEDSKVLPELIAPLITGGVNTLNYNLEKYAISDVKKTAWYCVKLQKDKSIKIIREATQEEKMIELGKISGFNAIILKNLGNQEYLCFPLNINDVETKGYDVTPFKVYLVDVELFPFYTILVKAWGNMMLFGYAVSEPPKALRPYIDTIEYKELPYLQGVAKEFRIAYELVKS